jgi:hypothetical protein
MEKCRERMGLKLQVKTRLLVAGMLCLSGFAAGEEAPDAREILKSVRVNQATQNKVLRGHLRTGPKVTPFRLVLAGNVIRYEFSEPPQTLALRLGEKDSRLEEITKGGTERVTPARFDDKVRGTDISYEDISLRFLYWSKATVEGEQTMLLRKSWKVRVEPPASADSQYSRVQLWIDKESGGLMQAEAFDQQGRLARRFKVVSGQKIDGAWMLKQMRIEAASAESSKDRTPTYLEIDGAEK